MSVLHLNLNKQWFDLHLNGKSEEYREITPYWCSRLLLNFNGERKPVKWWENNPYSISGLVFCKKIQYEKIIFSNGYKHVDVLPRFEKRYLSLQSGIGKKEWGAPNYRVFILKLGEPENITNYDSIHD